MSKRSTPQLSVIMITRNEAAGIAQVLASVDFADEIVVLDSGSTDDTVEICRSMGARVEVSADWQGFGVQKNRVLALARGRWILSLDADEQVSPPLAAEIQAVLGDPAGHVGWRLPRLSSYCGRALRRGGWWPDQVLRLVRREGARFSDDRVHERLIPPPGPVGLLTQALLHTTYADLEEVLRKVDQYSSEGAQQLHAAGRQSSFASAIGHGLWAFVRTYVLRLSCLEGVHGFMLAISNAEASYYRYAKLWLLRQQAAERQGLSDSAGNGSKR